MEAYMLMLLAAVVSISAFAAVIVWAAMRLGAREAEEDPADTQDDFRGSMARWGYLGDRRDGGDR